MPRHAHLVLVLTGIFASLGASYPTTNFLVEAPTQQIAENIGQWAEFYRKQKAIEWLGREMPPWQQRCPVRVRINVGGAGGATSFNFMGGQVWQTMEIEGPLDRLVASVLPHEVTHTVFAHYFRCPVPRWADEGGAVLSEDEIERSRHDMMTRQILNSGKWIPIHRLFVLRDYPRDPREVAALYAEGYSVADFLVGISNRQTFLRFVGHGMQSQYGWDNAAQTFYSFKNVHDLEAAWLASLRSSKPRQPPQTILASNDAPAQSDSAKRTIVRLTAPPAQPLLDDPQPVYRGQAPDTERPLSGRNEVQTTGSSRQGYLPDARPLAITNDQWQKPGVRLREPQAIGAGGK